MEFPAFVSKSYTLFSRKGSCARTVNLCLEAMEVETGRNQYAFYKRAGLKGVVRPSGGNGITRGSYEQNEHLFHVVGSQLYDLIANYSIPATYGPIVDDSLPVYMTGSSDTLMLVSGGQMYRIFGGTLTGIVTPFTPVHIGFISNRFVALSSSHQQFFWSDDDGVTWDALDFQTAEATANLMISMIVDHNLLWIIGNRISQVFAIGTNADAPFVPQQNAVIQQGTVARASVAALEHSLFWLGRNKNGERTVVRMNGYNPERISKHNIENALRSYAVVEDAIGQAYQLGGNSYYFLTFPTQNTTWLYSTLVDDWVEVPAWDTVTGTYQRHRANTIVSAFGKILGGDRANGWIFEISPDYYSDDVGGVMGNGGIIRWLRRAPHLVKENKSVRYSRMEIDCEKGVGDGSNGDPANGAVTPEHDPMMQIRWSDDGETYGNEYHRSMGKQGETKKEVSINRPGTGKDRVWEVSGTASVKTCIFNMFFDATTLAH